MTASPQAAQPPLTQPPIPTCVPIPLPTPGIDDSAVQVGPIGSSWDSFQTSDQWTGPLPGSSSIEKIWAGVTGDQGIPPDVPAVEVDVSTWSSDGCTVTTRPPQLYTDPSATGPLTIVEVRGGEVTLRTTSGGTIYFNVAAGTFSTWPSLTG